MDKPKLYRNNIDKIINNNKEVYTSMDKNISNIDNIIDIRNKINKILNSNEFIYSKKVNININNNIYIKKIIGIKDNNLITLDNEYIPLDIIKDIYL